MPLGKSGTEEAIGGCEEVFRTTGSWMYRGISVPNERANAPPSESLTASQ